MGYRLSSRRRADRLSKNDRLWLVGLDMNRLSFRLWLMVSITLALGAVIVRLAWEATYTTAAGSMAIIALLMLAILGIYALFLYLVIKPSREKVASLPVRVSFTVIITAGLTSGIVHYFRFIPSPEASSPLSVIIATLLLTGGISAYLLTLRVIWSIWKAKEIQRAP